VRQVGRRWRVAAATFLHVLKRDLQGRDVPLAAAGLTFYALIALLPLLLVALWLAALLLGGSEVRSLAGHLGDVVGSRHGLDRGLRHLASAGTTAPPTALITSLLVAVLYGEGFSRAFGRFNATAAGVRRSARGRLTAVVLIAVSAVLITGGLLLARWLSTALGSGPWWLLLGGYLAFLICWAGATLNVALCYRIFGVERFPPRAWWAAAAAGSWIAGSTLGFLAVLSLPIALGPPFAGNASIGAAALLAFWLYLCHIAVLIGYAAARRLSRQATEQVTDSFDMRRCSLAAFQDRRSLT
jgi:membrane protein